MIQDVQCLAFLSLSLALSLLPISLYFASGAKWLSKSKCMCIHLSISNTFASFRQIVFVFLSCFTCRCSVDSRRNTPILRSTHSLRHAIYTFTSSANCVVMRIDLLTHWPMWAKSNNKVNLIFIWQSRWMGLDLECQLHILVCNIVLIWCNAYTHRHTLTRSVGCASVSWAWSSFDLEWDGEICFPVLDLNQ